MILFAIKSFVRCDGCNAGLKSSRISDTKRKNKRARKLPITITHKLVYLMFDNAECHFRLN